jgi:hypothetical protein
MAPRANHIGDHINGEKHGHSGGEGAFTNTYVGSCLSFSIRFHDNCYRSGAAPIGLHIRQRPDFEVLVNLKLGRGVRLRHEAHDEVTALRITSRLEDVCNPERSHRKPDFSQYQQSVTAVSEIPFRLNQRCEERGHDTRRLT